MSDEQNKKQLNPEFTHKECVRIETDEVKNVIESVNRERGRAGILIGFYFLSLIQLYPYFSLLHEYVKGVITILLFIVTYLLIDAFCSTKCASGIDVKNSLTYGWKSKTHFYEKLFERLYSNKEELKDKLTDLSKKIRWALYLLAVVYLIIFSYNEIYMTDIQPQQTQEEQPDGENPFGTDYRQLSQDPTNNTQIDDSIDTKDN